MASCWEMTGSNSWSRCVQLDRQQQGKKCSGGVQECGMCGIGALDAVVSRKNTISNSWEGSKTMSQLKWQHKSTLVGQSTKPAAQLPKYIMIVSCWQ